MWNARTGEEPFAHDGHGRVGGGVAVSSDGERVATGSADGTEGLCLLGLEESRDLPMHPRYGASWEGFCLEQTLLAHGQREAYFYRTRRGAELDLMLVRRGRRWGFEFKCTDAPRTTRSMHIAIADLNLEHLWVIYPGSLEYPLGERITALPLSGVRELPLRPP